MEKKTYRFNENGVCVNPTRIGERPKNYMSDCAIIFAEDKNGFVFGYRLAADNCSFGMSSPVDRDSEHYAAFHDMIKNAICRVNKFLAEARHQDVAGSDLRNATRLRDELQEKLQLTLF